MYRRSRFLLSSVVSLVAAGYLATLAGVSPAAAAQISSQQITQFLANPSELLKGNPNGGGRLVQQIRDLMMSEPCMTSAGSAACQQTLAAIIGLLKGATDAQKTAIGTGLADAAQLVVGTNPTLATDIQTALAASGDKLATEAYQTTVGNTAIGAAGGGGGGSNAAAYETLTNTGGGGGGGLSTGPTGTGTAGFGLTSGGSVSSPSTVSSSTSPI